MRVIQQTFELRALYFVHRINYSCDVKLFSSDLDSLQLLYFAVDGGLEMCGFPVYLTCWLRHVGLGSDFGEMEEAVALPPCHWQLFRVHIGCMASGLKT